MTTKPKINHKINEGEKIRKYKYVGGWSINGGSTYADGYKYLSLREARKSMRGMAVGNTPRGSRGYWYVNLIGCADRNDHVADGRV